MKDECEKLKVRPYFQFTSDAFSTGKFAVLLNDNNPRIVTHLGATKALRLDQVPNPDTWNFVEKTRVNYIAEYAIDFFYERILNIAQHAFNWEISSVSIQVPWSCSVSSTNCGHSILQLRGNWGLRRKTWAGIEANNRNHSTDCFTSPSVNDRK